MTIQVLLLCIIVLVLLKFKFALYHHVSALYYPWLLVVFLSVFEISYLHTRLDTAAYLAVFVFLGCYYVGSRVYVLASNKRSAEVVEQGGTLLRRSRYRALILIFLLLTLVNIGLSGYIPLVELITTGDSRYLDFGVSGVYGFYNAYANALGVLSFYLYARSGRLEYLLVFFLIVTVFVAFVTRQNLLSLLVEAFVVYGFAIRKMNFIKPFLAVFIIVVLFSVFGDVRTANIAEVLEVKGEYQDLPTVVFWLYGYFYISFVNLGNAIAVGPYYDGSSILALLPNVVKSYIGYGANHEYFLQKVNFTVSTGLQKMYSDFGFLALAVYGALFGFLAQQFHIRSRKYRRFFDISVYSVLFFCATFSFFVNFWFYLPVVFQIFFFYLFAKMVLISEN